MIQNELFFPEGISVCEDVTWAIKTMLMTKKYVISDMVGYKYNVSGMRRLTFSNYDSQVWASEYWIEYFKKSDLYPRLGDLLIHRFADMFVAFSVSIPDIESKEEREKCYRRYDECYKMAHFSGKVYYRMAPVLKTILGSEKSLALMLHLYKRIKGRSVLEWK